MSLIVIVEVLGTFRPVSPHGSLPLRCVNLTEIFTWSSTFYMVKLWRKLKIWACLLMVPLWHRICICKGSARIIDNLIPQPMIGIPADLKDRIAGSMGKRVCQLWGGNDPGYLLVRS